MQEKSEKVSFEVKNSLKKVDLVISNLEKSIHCLEAEINNVHAEVKSKADDILQRHMELVSKLQVCNNINTFCL